MARNLLPIYQWFGTDGLVLDSGFIYTYITNTTTNKATYTASSGGSTNANPIVLGSDGINTAGAEIWLDTDAEYTIVVKTSALVTIVTLDNVRGIPSTDILLNTALVDPNADRLVFWDDSESVSAFLTAGTGLTITAATMTVDAEAAINAASFTAAVATTSDSILLLDADDSSNVKTEAISDLVTLISDNLTVLLPTPKLGLVLSQDTDTDHDILISTGYCSDTTNTVRMTLSTAITKQIDASWAAGDDAGGFPTGISIATATWYHVFLIQHTDGTVDAGFDTSTSASNLLSTSSYTYYKRIGAVLTDASSNITAFTTFGTNGEYFSWNAMVQDEANNNPGTSAITKALTVPTGVNVLADIAFSINDDSVAADYYVTLFGAHQTDTTPSVSNFSMIMATSGTNNCNTVKTDIITDTSAQIKYRTEVSDADIDAYITTYGWKELW